METFYRGIETSLLGLSLALGIAVAAVATRPPVQPGPQNEIVLPLVDVVGRSPAG